MNEMQTDSVDTLINQWQTERPDLDLSGMRIVGRVVRVGKVLEPILHRELEKYGLNFAEFDVLSALRRRGEPYVMSPTELYSTLLITSGTITHRLKLLEQRGFICREPNEKDSRSMLVRLTESGKSMIDRTIEDYSRYEKQLIDGFSEEQLAGLETLLRQFLVHWETEGQK